MSTLKKPFSEIRKSLMPQKWTSYKNPLKHVALNDAIEQAHMFIEILRDNGQIN